MKIFYLILITIIFLQACKKSGGDIYSSVQITYVDNNGHLLFTDGQNGYYKDSLKVYDYQNGVKTLIPLGFYWSPWASSTIVTGSNNNDVINQYTINIIHLKSGVDDTLKIHLSGNQQYGSLYDIIWYNGKLKKNAALPFDSITNTDIFTIIH